jgi:hypothetical protein
MIARNLSLYLFILAGLALLALLFGAPIAAGPMTTPTSGPSATAALVASPYIGETTPTSVVVAWATDASGASEVHYSTDTSYSQTATASSFLRDGKYWHSATITGLTADTTYHYRVYTGGVDLTPWTDVTFRTAPSSDATQITFAGLGDSRPGSTSSDPSTSARNVAAQMDQRDFAFAIHTGDIVYGGGVCTGSDSGWNQYLRGYFDLYEDSIKQAPFYTAIGNHELGSGSASCGYDAYTGVYYLPENAPSGDEERYYSFDWGNIHVVVLNTEQTYSTGSTQYNWLENDLQNTDRRWIVAAFHRPAYSSGPHGSEEAVQDYLVPLFEQYGVDVVLNGHDHIYERTCPIKDGACTTIDDGGVVYFVTGGAGASSYTPDTDWFTAKASNKHHFMMLSVDDCTMNIETIDDQGNVFDTLEIDKCLANFAPSDDIGITGGNDVQLSWQHVTKDSTGKDITVAKYYTYRDTTPYKGTAATQADTVNGPFSANDPVTWTDADHIGDAATNYFYYVRSVVMDGVREILSEPSNHTGEFDFALTPGN